MRPRGRRREKGSCVVESYLTAVIQGGALVILGVIVWFTMTKTIPAMFNLFRSERAEDRKVFRDEQDASREAFLSTLNSVQERSEKAVGELGQQMLTMGETLGGKIEELAKTIRANGRNQS